MNQPVKIFSNHFYFLEPGGSFSWPVVDGFIVQFTSHSGVKRDIHSDDKLIPYEPSNQMLASSTKSVVPVAKSIMFEVDCRS